MDTDEEIKNLINDYVRQIESKEEDLVGLQRNIDGIISVAKQELSRASGELDKKFDANEITEEEYLTNFKSEKENILKRVKEKLDAMLANYEKTYTALELS